MTDQPSTTGDEYTDWLNREPDWDDPESLRWPRPHDPNWPPDWPKTIPLDFIYDPETEVYYAPGTPCDWDVEEVCRELARVIEEVRSQPGYRRERIKVGPFKPSPAGGSRARPARSLFRFG